MKVWHFDDPLVYNIILIFFFHFLSVTFSFDFQIGEGSTLRAVIIFVQKYYSMCEKSGRSQPQGMRVQAN